MASIVTWWTYNSKSYWPVAMHPILKNTEYLVVREILAGFSFLFISITNNVTELGFWLQLVKNWIRWTSFDYVFLTSSLKIMLWGCTTQQFCQGKKIFLSVYDYKTSYC